MKWTRNAVLWALFFLICFGLGYPTLNRYDPRNTGGLSDTSTYYELATQGPAHADPQLKYRLLIPELSRPIANAATGHIGTWNPVFFGFLIVNSFFTASTAFLLVIVARRLGASEAVAIVAAALYLLNFETANIRLSGMVDSAEGFCLLAMVWTLLTKRTALLALWAILGTLSRETFVPLCIAFTIGWFLAAPRFRWGIALIPSLAALLSIAVLQSAVSGQLMLPWQFAAALHPDGGHLAALYHNVIDQNLLYSIVWLVPLGLPRLKALPRSWVAACAAAALVDFALVTWHSSVAGAAARPLFSVAGPILSLSAAMYLSGEKDRA
ncbi:MAG TPA: hypothetical protein VG273_12615 [Bryobacteraceae bacterium]|jgi:hypothetical protein|nr:hypothetical protein [Bryobacteraceae bacterium]